MSNGQLFLAIGIPISLNGAMWLALHARMNALDTRMGALDGRMTNWEATNTTRLDVMMGTGGIE